MAIAEVGSLGTGAEGNSSDTSFTLTTTADLNAGNEGILVIVSDNAAEATGETNHHTSVTDSGSNTWEKLAEYTYSAASAAGDGLCTSFWRVRPGSTLSSGATVTMNQSANCAEKCASLHEFTATNPLQYVTGSKQNSSQASPATNPESLAISGLTSKEYLFFRSVGKEINSTTALTPTTNYTAIAGTRSRNNAAAVIVRGEFRILTGTGSTSAPTLNVISDTVGIFLALEETAAGGGATCPGWVSKGGWF